MKKLLIWSVCLLALWPLRCNAIEFVRQKNVATRIVIPIVDADGDPVSGATGLDTEIDAYSDASGPDGYIDATNEATEIGSSGSYAISLTQAEMNVDYISGQTKSNDGKTQWWAIRTVVGDPLLIATTDDGGPINVTGGVVDQVTTLNGQVTVATNNDKTGYSLTQSFPANFADLAITATTGQVTVGTNNDKTGYEIAGALTKLDDMNDLSGYDVQSAAEAALETYHLDHLLAAAVAGADVIDNSLFAYLVSKSGTADWDSFVNTTDSLEALRDRGDAAWTTGGGGSISEILNIQALVPLSIDLAGTATVRIALGLTNMLDDLPATAEIAPGTITIDRKAIGGTSWTNIVNAAACSELAGLIYYDEVFDSGSGYAEGDSIRITFKSQKITVDANDFEITGSDGWIFQTSIRQTMRGTDGANTTTPPTVAQIQAEMEENGASILDTISDKLPDNYIMGSSDKENHDDEIDAIKLAIDRLPLH